MGIPGGDDKSRGEPGPRQSRKAERKHGEGEFVSERYKSAGLFPGMTDNNKGGHGMKWKKWPHPFTDNPGLVHLNVSVSQAAGDGK